jgi:hypothetical protein
VPPDSRFTVSLTLPVPDAAHDDPDEATHVHVAPLSAEGSVSVTVAPTTADGPLFVVTIVYVTLVPGTSVVEPSVFVIRRSVDGDNESVSVAELLVLVGSVTPVGVEIDAVFASEPVAVASMEAVSV